MRCTIKFKGVCYVKYMSFGLIGEPLTKEQRTDSGSVAGSYALAYEYGDADHPTAPSQIGHERYTYDANGNPTLVEDDSLNTERRMAWDEENRLMALSDNGKTSRYTYNAAGERIVKSHGYLEGVYVNGAPQGLTSDCVDFRLRLGKTSKLLFLSACTEVPRNGGIHHLPRTHTQRYAPAFHQALLHRRQARGLKIGAGIFQNAYGHGANVVTAGQKDYQMRMMQIEKQREDYYRKLGTPPGVPTMKGATAEPENTHEGYNTIIKELGDHSVPDGWIQRPKRNAVPDTPPDPPVQWDKAEDPDDVQPGYGYVPADTAHHEDIFYYHTDHLGFTSYITDAKANVAQFDAYLPYGELLVDEHSSSEEMPYKFNGKELDSETGLYYYGARYMNPRTSLWYGVDPLAEKYPEIGGYIYCHNNPIVFFDPNGMEEDDDKKISALKSINQFEQSTTQTVFKNIPKEKFIKDLRNHINNPRTIQQGNNGTCGAAAISKYLAEEQPDLYAKTAISLYTTGFATNRGLTLSVTGEMKNGTVGDLHNAGLNSVAAIMQGALTNLNNNWLTINTFKGESGSNSFMWPGFIKSFLNKFVGVDVRNIGAFPTIEALKKIDYNKYFVIGLVHENRGRIASGLIPNHYVQLLGFNNKNYAS